MIGDFDADGRLDLAALDFRRHPADPSVLSVLLADPDRPGSFLPYTGYPLADLVNWLERGGFDGDGLLDLAVGGGSEVTVLLNRSAAPGVFSGSPVDSVVPTGGTFAAAGDFDGDGRLDLALIGNSGGVPILLGRL